MASLMEKASQAVSITQVSRSAKEILEKLTRGGQDRFVVLKNNAPAAVLLSVPAFEALMDELDDLRVEATARARRRTLRRGRTLSHKQMMRRFGRSRAG